MSFNETKIDEGVLKGLRVLVAEDNELNRKIAINLLESRGMIVDQAEDGEKAYNKYIENEDYYYDVIFLDVRMPIMDGLECAQLIRRAKKGDSSNIILIAMTANAFQEDYDKSAKAGINYHLVKPIDPSILYRTVARLIGERNELRRKSINKK